MWHAVDGEPICSFVSDFSLMIHFILISEVILTLGSSRTVLEFLCAAKEKKRSFRVFVAEGAPRFSVSFFLRFIITIVSVHLTQFYRLPILLYYIGRYQGHLLAKELVARGLQTTVITDSAVFAMISRVNMVRIWSILPKSIVSCP